MAKVTSKYQVTVPKAIADRYNIRPGDQIEWTAAGEGIRVVLGGRAILSDAPKSRLHWFDLATKRHQEREGARRAGLARDRGWKREDLYERGRSH